MVEVFEDGWMLEQLDLPPGDDVLIRFTLDSDGNAQADGWYLDDVWVGPQDPVRLAVPFTDDFEGGLGNWIVSGYDWGLMEHEGKGGSFALTDSPQGDYARWYTVSATLVHPRLCVAAHKRGYVVVAVMWCSLANALALVAPSSRDAT